MRCNYRLACSQLTRTIGAAALVAGVTLAGASSGAPAVVSAKPMYVPVPSPQPPSQGPLVIAITGQAPESVIIGDPGGDGSGPKAAVA